MRPIAIALSLFIAAVAIATPQRAIEIAEQFTKTKYKNKQKRGYEKSVYRDVQSRVDVRSPQAYSGHYDAELGGTNTITIEVTSDGVVTGRGSGPGEFTLRNGRVRDGLLTATKVYDDGSTEPLEGAFLAQKIREGTAADRITNESSRFGLGIVGIDYQITSGIRVDKLFYRRLR